MSNGYSIMVDTSKCTACRGCQIACKQWNQLPATVTKNWGSYQNPQDLSADTWKLVRFSDGSNQEGKPYWLFFRINADNASPQAVWLLRKMGKLSRRRRQGLFYSHQKQKTWILKLLLRDALSISLDKTPKQSSFSNAPCVLTGSPTTKSPLA